MNTTATPETRPTAAHHEPARIVIVAGESAWRLPDLREAWRYRELFWVFALRDIRVRYKQTALGVAWAVVQPLLTMVAFTTIARLGQLSTNGVRPEVFYFCGMLPWLLFSNALTSASTSLVGNQHLITKVYFPRIVIPAASVLTALVDFGISFVVLLGLMVAYRVPPAPQIVLLPLFVALASLAASGFGFWLAALHAEFRDVRHVTPFLTQIWLFCTPVLYSSTSVRAPYQRALLALNPMTGIVEGVRWCVLGRPPPGAALASCVLVTLAVLVTSLAYFHRVERTLADRL